MRSPSSRVRRLFVLAAALLLLATGGLRADAAGSANDPLVTRSYAESWAEAVLKDVLPNVETRLGDFAARATASAVGSVTPQSAGSLVSLAAGDSLSVSTGCVFTLIQGAADVRIDSGAVVNVTVGHSAVSGKLNLNHRYIACENTGAVVTAGADSVFVMEGSYSGSGRILFEDVAAGDWFYAYVYLAVERGLVEGVTDTRFAPASELTLAQTLKLAACMHQLYGEGEVTLQNGDPWYASYVDYAVKNGIAEASYAALSAAEYNAPVSRREYVHLFRRALPDSEYTQTHEVESIPDVAHGDLFAEDIFLFYRAGILEGSLDDGSFLPDTNIRRSEVAAIMARMFDTNERK